jgi:hypothetical protein
VWFAKFESGLKLGGIFSDKNMHAPYAEIVLEPDRSQFVFPPRLTTGDFGVATTAHCPAGTVSPTRAHYSGQSLLGDVAMVLVGVEAHACHRPAGHSRSLASSRFQVVLDMALAA